MLRCKRSCRADIGNGFLRNVARLGQLSCNILEQRYVMSNIERTALNYATTMHLILVAAAQFFHESPIESGCNDDGGNDGQGHKRETPTCHKEKDQTEDQ